MARVLRVSTGLLHLHHYYMAGINNSNILATLSFTWRWYFSQLCWALSTQVILIYGYLMKTKTFKYLHQF